MAVSHVYSNTNADATGTLTIWNGATTSSVVASDLVKPSDWNSAHNQLMTLSGNTSGSSTLSGTNIVFGGTNGITLSASSAVGAATLWVRGNDRTLNYFPKEPVAMATSTYVSGTSGGTGGSTQFTVSAYVNPMYLEDHLVFNRVEMLVSGQASSAGTGSHTNGYMVGIYTNNNSSLSLLTSFQWCMFGSQSSISANSKTWFWGTNSTSNSLSTTGNVSATFTRLAKIILYDSTGVSLTPGSYYVAVIYTNRTSSVAFGQNLSAMCLSYSQSTGASDFGRASLRPDYDQRWHGQFSTTLNASNFMNFSFPNVISSSAITNTGGSSQVRWNYVKFYNSVSS